MLVPQLHRYMESYAKAIADFNKAAAIDPSLDANTCACITGEAVRAACAHSWSSVTGKEGLDMFQ